MEVEVERSKLGVDEVERACRWVGWMEDISGMSGEEDLREDWRALLYGTGTGENRCEGEE